MPEMPKIISLDDHLIEPAHLWRSRLPSRYREEGPHVVVAPRGDFTLDGASATYIEKPGDGPEMAAWWGTFPRSKETASSIFGHLDEEAVHKIARGNAIRLLELDLTA